MLKTLNAEGQNFKVDRLGRVKISQERRDALLVEFDRSGMSGQQFAKSVGVKYSTWASWVQKRRQAKGLIVEEKPAPEPVAVVAKQSMRWLEAQLDPTPAPSLALVVHGPNGIRFEIQDETQARLAGVVLKQLQGLC
jgi:hypothetical protein